MNSLPYASVPLLVLSTLSSEKIRLTLPVLPKLHPLLVGQGHLVKVGKVGSVDSNESHVLRGLHRIKRYQWSGPTVSQFLTADV